MLDLSFVYSLFVEGMVCGGALAAFPWLIGFAVASIYNLVKRG